MAPLVSDDGWTLSDSVESDIDRLMVWFPSDDAIRLWGGPGFRFPFTRHSFVEDMCWGKMASFSMRDPAGSLTAFGQLYEKFGCINLARLVVDPDTRCQGIGKRLVSMLMNAGRPMFSCAEFSLFVFRDNKQAFRCYQSMGFAIVDYPDEMLHGDICYYLTRPVGNQGRSNAP